MNLGGGQEDKRSICGGLGSLVVFITMIFYAYTKADVLYTKRGVDILSAVNDSYFSPDYVFNHDNGLNFAVGFTAYDSNREEILEPEIGEIIFNLYSWGPEPDGTYKSERVQIPHHNCSPEELGISENSQNEAKFLPTYSSSL